MKRIKVKESIKELILSAVSTEKSVRVVNGNIYVEGSAPFTEFMHDTIGKIFVIDEENFIQVKSQRFLLMPWMYDEIIMKRQLPTTEVVGL